MKLKAIMLATVMSLGMIHVASAMDVIDWDKDPTLSRIVKDKKIILGVRKTSAPMSSLVKTETGEKKYEGLAVDLCMKTVDELKKKVPDLKVEFFEVDSKTRIQAVKEGKIDLECGSTTNNNKRQSDVNFSVPYFVSSVMAVTLKTNPLDSLENFQHGVLVYTKGTTTQKVVEDYFKGVAVTLMKAKNKDYGTNVVYGDDHQQSFDMLAQHKADIFVNDEVLITGLINTSKDKTIYKMLRDRMSVEPYGIMSRKDSQITKIVDDVIVTSFKDGSFQNLWDKWLPGVKPSRTMADYIRQCRIISAETCKTTAW
ncbi:amino acid ABC transporter substrate-binding protein [Aquitalea pelogenes]|uniref:amino acid ABC transporter substrate-binding protein n=1 Tax=Aquitalea pelogenes TaxID=1293573 RepID=UPI0035B370C1